ncbi:phosphoribosylformylglycinamidine cyclo-ligase [Treponema sp. J25]|uniref:phosphoribosylformylglycinamidine cyclo-ligase n=1 Tax=Treponema sp. J25 TaxID=2094121 RepID=UPI001047ED48|nr:phosphoribosylformylglycinamidine cyclo-ligase [Treponema sp. J25]TCW61796.1 phosphoribosylformylglycinamidine cyclo-ligase [Treponema sp. J25]
MDYKEAGVDIEEGYRAVEKYKDLARGTMQENIVGRSVINEIGSFAGMLSLRELIAAGEGMEDPVLVSGTDGVGTKLDIAFRLQKYDTVGIDCVAMCVNDILCHGARPLFFLDYLACGKLDADVAADLVKGVARGCAEAGCVLLGGETAEMPGFYDIGKYDIAGFAVGIVDRKKIINGQHIEKGDLLIGLASSGPHSNGYSLIRKVIPDLQEDFGGMPIGYVLLEPTRIYVQPILALMEKILIKGMAHITGGGFYENIPRMFARPQTALIYEDSWPIPPVFYRIAYGVAGGGTGKDAGSRETAGKEILFQDEQIKQKMFNTFNMGIGLVLAVSKNDGEQAVEFLDSMGYPAYIIGEVGPYPLDENALTGTSGVSSREAGKKIVRGGKNPGLGEVVLVRP